MPIDAEIRAMPEFQAMEDAFLRTFTIDLRTRADGGHAIAYNLRAVSAWTAERQAFDRAAIAFPGIRRNEWILSATTCHPIGHTF